MRLPSASVVSRVTTRLPLMGTPVTTLPSPNSSCIMPPGPPGPCIIIIAPGGGGGGGAGASLCAAARELIPSSNSPHNIGTKRELARFLKRISYFPLTLIQLSKYCLTSVDDSDRAHQAVITYNYVGDLGLSIMLVACTWCWNLHPHNLRISGADERIAEHQGYIFRVIAGLRLVSSSSPLQCASASGYRAPCQNLS